MRVAQSGIFALGTGLHAYLEFDLHAGGDPLTLVQIIANYDIKDPVCDLIIDAEEDWAQITGWHMRPSDL